MTPSCVRTILASSVVALATLGGTPAFAAQPANSAQRFCLDGDAASIVAGFKRVADTDTFTTERGYGFDLGTAPAADDKPYYFSAAVPEGNFRVTVTFGHATDASDNTVKVESRQLMLAQVTTTPGEFVTRSFIVNVRNARIPPPEKNAPGGSAVVLNEREAGLLRWDDKLTIEFNGPAPHVRKVAVEPVTCPTVFLVGDSTVCDQPYEPGASWGQMLPSFFKPEIAFANHAESGETLKSFISGLRLAKVLSQITAGDYLFIQFGHNDEKKQWPQTYVKAHATYDAYLRVFIAEANLRGATPVLVTPVQRRTFDEHGKIQNTHGEYPDAMREVSADEQVALIGLDRASTVFYEALGPERAPFAFSNGGKDATHHNNYGAYELAKCVLRGMYAARLPLTQLLVEDFSNFDPAAPDSPDIFKLAASPGRREGVQRGN